MPAASPLLGSTGSTTYVLAAVLIVLGVGMVATCIWLVRATRTDSPVLGPLEVMGSRRFARSGADERTVVLAGARPVGAPAPAPMVEIDEPGSAGPDDVTGAAADAEAADEPAAEPAVEVPDPSGAVDAGPDEPIDASPQAR